MPEIEIAPLNQAVAVITDDTNNFIIGGNAKKTQALFVGTGGDVNAVFPDGSAVVFSSVPSGTWLWIKIQRVNYALTTAANMVALFRV